MIKSTLRASTLAMALLLGLGLSACGGGGGGGGSPSSGTTDSSGSSSITSLSITDTVVGTGNAAIAGNSLSVTYTGWLYDVKSSNLRGSQFDSNVGGQAFVFKLGAGTVIAGWDQGLVGMKVGGKRTLIIPAALAYGSAGAAPAIPPNAALVFDVTLSNIQ